MSYDILADIVRHKREGLNMTQEEIADRIDVSRQTISHWENGYIMHMSVEKVASYSEILGLPEVAFLHPESYLEMDYIDPGYIEMASLLQENKISSQQLLRFIDLVNLLRLDLEKNREK